MRKSINPGNPILGFENVILVDIVRRLSTFSFAYKQCKSFSEEITENDYKV